MSDQWDRFDASSPRTLRNLGFEDNITVEEPTETYDPDKGGYVTEYSEVATVTGEVAPPSADPQVTEGGTLAEKDLMVYVNNDEPYDFTEYGDSGSGAARLSIDGYDDNYRVEERNEQLDGYIQLGCVEI
jgi:hypothetical protein